VLYFCKNTTGVEDCYIYEWCMDRYYEKTYNNTTKGNIELSDIMDNFYLCGCCDGYAFWDYDADCLGANRGLYNTGYSNNARAFAC
jgi:hypothetical protein